MEGKEFWIISVPLNAREDTFGELDRKLKPLSPANYQLTIPTLRVGTLDSLMALSDDLVKIDMQVENTVKKIGRQYWDLLDNKPERREIQINTTSPDTYITKFKWEDAKYSRRKTLKELTDEIKTQVGKYDDELKLKSQDYQQISQEISAQEKKESGSLLVRDLSSIITKEHIMETDFMTTVIIVIPKSEEKEFRKEYEFLAEYVLPRSAVKIVEDMDHALFTVNMFKIVADDFRNAARDKFRWTTRKFEIATGTGKKDTKDLMTKRDKLKPTLLRWCQLHFGEAFIAWIHLKCIRVFVESVLRFGLPANFQAMLVTPTKKTHKKMREVLKAMYRHLGGGDEDLKDEIDGATAALVAVSYTHLTLPTKRIV
eukprot:TRINITY_DN11604_c0_g1_i2.p1 TRINITY_DN11604_c0_g1~~TRINITY_DN11604_c0_g1_i2.p1  ORF type:complete len:371 (-),score=78.08 TRINITY_DN11604_c0_g1_i2:7-1119(-)